MPERHIHLVIDALDHRALTAADLPIRPAQLPCARCGEPRSAHGIWSECRQFQRPVLPAGHGYVDELATGAAFRFLDPGRASCVHVVTQRGQVGRHGSGLVQVDAEGSACGAAAYVLHEATIVQLEDPPPRTTAHAQVPTEATGPVGHPGPGTGRTAAS